MFGMQSRLRNMLSPTLPNPSEAGERVNPSSTGKGGTDTLWTRVGFCVTMGQKLRNVPSKSLFQGIDEAFSAIELRRHSLTSFLNPPPPQPWGLAGWLGVGEKSVRWSGR